MIFLAGFLQDALGIQPLKILTLNVLAVESAKPQLRSIYKALYDISDNSVDNSDDFADSFSVFQHTSPCCRAARSKELYDLSSAYILRHLSDCDIKV